MGVRTSSDPALPTESPAGTRGYSVPAVHLSLGSALLPQWTRQIASSFSEMVKTSSYYLSLRREDIGWGERGSSADTSTAGVCAGQGAQRAWNGFCTSLLGIASTRASAKLSWYQLRVASFPNNRIFSRIFQLANFLKGSFKPRNSTRAFLAGTKFSRPASFSCPKEMYFFKLFIVEKFHTQK